MTRCALLTGLLIAAGALSGCAARAGDSALGEWLVSTSASRAQWLWMDNTVPEDQEIFLIDATPAAFPDGDFEAGIELRVRVSLEPDGGDAAATGAVTLSLRHDDQTVASQSVDRAAAGVTWDILLTDLDGLAACDGSGPCTLRYTLTGTLDGPGVLAVGDAELSAWIIGSGTPPPDAALTFSFL